MGKYGKGKLNEDLGETPKTIRGNSEANIFGKKISFQLEEPASATFGKLLPLGSVDFSRRLTIGTK